MIDPKQVRSNPDRLKEIIRLRKVDPARADVDRWMELDKKRRALQTEIDSLNSEKKKIAALGKADPDRARAKGQELRERSKDLDAQFTEVTSSWQECMEWFPNWIDPGMPEGAGEENNVEECAWVPAMGYLEPNQLGTANHSRRVHAAEAGPC